MSLACAVIPHAEFVDHYRVTAPSVMRRGGTPVNATNWKKTMTNFIIEWAPFWGALLILWLLTDGIVLLERKYGEQARRFFRTRTRR